VADHAVVEVYKDPTLQGLIKEALAANEDLKLRCTGRRGARQRRHRQGRLLAEVKRPGRRDLRAEPLEEPAARRHGEGIRRPPGERQLGDRSLGPRSQRRTPPWPTCSPRGGSAQASCWRSSPASPRRISSCASSTSSSRTPGPTRDPPGHADPVREPARGGIASDLELNQARADLAVTRAATRPPRRPSPSGARALRAPGRPPGPIARGADLLATQLPPEPRRACPPRSWSGARTSGREQDVLASAAGSAWPWPTGCRPSRSPASSDSRALGGRGLHRRRPHLERRRLAARPDLPGRALKSAEEAARRASSSSWAATGSRCRSRSASVPTRRGHAEEPRHPGGEADRGDLHQGGGPPRQAALRGRRVELPGGCWTPSGASSTRSCKLAQSQRDEAPEAWCRSTGRSAAAGWRRRRRSRRRRSEGPSARGRGAARPLRGRRGQEDVERRARPARRLRHRDRPAVAPRRSTG